MKSPLFDFVLGRRKGEPRNHRRSLSCELLESRQVLATDLALGAPITTHSAAHDVPVAMAADTDEASFEKIGDLEQFTELVLDAAREKYSSTASSTFPLITSGSTFPFHVAKQSEISDTDGSYLFKLNNNRLTIIDVRDPTDMKLVSRTDLSINPDHVFVSDDRVALVATADLYQSDATSEVTVLDVSNPAAPVQTQAITLDGYFAGGQLVDSRLHVILDDRDWLPSPYLDFHGFGDRVAEPLDDYLGRVQELVPSLLPSYTTTVDGNVLEDKLVEITDVYLPPTSVQPALRTIASIDLAAPTLAINAISVPSSAVRTLVHSTDDGLFIADQTMSTSASQPFSVPAKTTIQRFQLGPIVELVAARDIGGYLFDENAMDESSGHLRVALSDGTLAEQDTEVHVFDITSPELAIQASFHEINVSDRLRSVRFDGDFVYLGGDDLTLIRDVSIGNTNGEVVARTILPERVIPLENDLLLSFEGDWGNKKQIALHDVSDGSSPVRLGQYSFPNTTNDLGWNYSGTTYLANDGLLAIPLNSTSSIWGSSNHDDSAMYLFDVSRESGLSLRSVDHHHSPTVNGLAINQALISISDSAVYSLRDRTEQDSIRYLTSAVADEYTFASRSGWELDALENDVLADDASNAQIISAGPTPGLDVMVANDGTIVASIQPGYHSCPQSAPLDATAETRSAKLTIACWSTDDGSPRIFRIPYTIRDNLGIESESIVNVHFEPQVVAHNDFETVAVGSSINVFPIENDRLEIPATITDLDTSGTRGTVELLGRNSNNPRFEYTAPVDFVGDDSFLYTLTSDDGSVSDWATVTLRVEGIGDEDRTAEYSLEVTNANGSPVSEVTVGQNFYVSLYVQDTTPFQPGGVFSAYADIRFDASLIQVKGEIEFGNEYPSARNGDVDNVDGWVDEVGGVANIKPIRGDRTLIARIPFVATSEGTMRLRTNPADNTLQRPTLLFGMRNELLGNNLKYKGADLHVVAASHPSDLNGDGAVGPLDALMAINELSSRTGSAENPQPSSFDRFDVNGDGVFSPLDPLTIINQLPSSAAVTKLPVALPHETRNASRTSRIKDSRRTLASEFLFASDDEEFRSFAFHQWFQK